MSPSERQRAVLNALRLEPRLPQRELARRAGVSLGMVNLLLRRLEADGLVLSDRSAGRPAYNVTPRGESEAIRQSYQRASRALRDVSLIRKSVQVEVLKDYASGGRRVSIIGDGSLALLAEAAVLELSLAGLDCRRLALGAPLPAEGLVLLDVPGPAGPDAGRVRSLGEFAGEGS